MAMADVFDHFEDELSVFTRAFDAVEDQVEVLFAIDGAVVGMECFASGETFKLFFDKLIKSYAMDAMQHTYASLLLGKGEGPLFM